MSNRTQDCSIRILQWTLGLVVLIESCLLAFEPGRIHSFAKTGLPYWIRPALAWPEIAGAVLFLIPATCAWGARLLLVIFGLAALVHLLHGHYDVGNLLVLAAGVLVVLRCGDGRPSRDVPTN